MLGLAKNDRLKAAIVTEQAAAAAAYEQTRKAARVFKDFRYRTLKSWTCERRVVGKAEHLDKSANPRFVVTSIAPEQMEARALYEDLCCGRGEMENRIKEQQLDLLTMPRSSGHGSENSPSACAITGRAPVGSFSSLHRDGMAYL